MLREGPDVLGCYPGGWLVGKVIEAVGNRYGRLVVVKEAGRNTARRVLWLCKCDCGNETVVSGTHLRSGATQSCGCLNREAIDEVGNRYGRLLVLAEVGRTKWRAALWRCQCDCGNIVVVTGASLRSGNTQSCGCLQEEWVVDVTKREEGNRYGRLTVIERAGSNKHGGAQWLCQCSCGKEVIVLGCSLRLGRTQSCGCLGIERSREASCLPEGEAALNRLYRQYRTGASQRGLSFELTKADFKRLTQQPCFYCGVEPLQGCCNNEWCNGEYIHNGLDRMDNNNGYTLGNVVPCCKYCNRAKNTLTVEEFLGLAERIYNHSIKDTDARCLLQEI